LIGPVKFQKFFCGKIKNIFKRKKLLFFMHVKGLALEDPCGILPFPLSLLASSSLREFQIQRSLKVDLSPILTFLKIYSLTRIHKNRVH
jgi:hypothetical protein